MGSSLFQKAKRVMNSSISPDNSKPPLKERLLPDVKTEKGLEKARKYGVLAAGYLGVAFIVTIFTTGTIFDPYPSAPADKQLIIIISVIGALFWFFASYRIAKKKGRIVIWFVLVYAAFSLLTKLEAGATGGYGSFLSLLAVWGAINGVRAIRVTSSNKLKQATDQIPQDHKVTDGTYSSDEQSTSVTFHQLDGKGQSGKGKKGKFSPTKWLGILGNTVALGFSLLLIGAQYPDLYVASYGGNIRWMETISLYVMATCFSMNLYVILRSIRDIEMLTLAREVKKARMEKELHEIKASMVNETE
jgi:hypothetical protein